MLGKLYDVAIVGTELAGLVAGALLVKRGYQVLLLDVESQRLQVKREGYTLKPFPGLFFGFGTGQVFTDVFTELGVPFLEKKRFQLAQPAYQVVAPDLRLDINQGREDWIKGFHFVSSADTEPLTNLLNEAEHYASVVRGMLAGDTIYPAFSFRERYRLNRASGGLGTDFRDGARLDYAEFLDSFGLSPRARSFLEAQFYFLAPIYPDRPTTFFAALVLSNINKGIFEVEGGLRVLEDICKERISSYRGQLQRAGEIEDIDFGRINEIKLAGVKEPVRCKKLLVSSDPEDLLSRFSPKSLKGDYGEYFEIPNHRRHDFSLYVAIDANVVPVGMKENVIMLADPGAPITSTNLLFISVSPVDNPDYAPAGKRLVSLTAVVEPEAEELTAVEARRIGDVMVEHLYDLMPFLNDHLEFIAYDESFALYQATRRSAALPPVDNEDRFGIGCLPNRTPNKEVYYAGKGTLPGLGMEGEGISAVMAANLLTKVFAK